MQHDFIRVGLRVMRVALTPIVTDGVGEDISQPAEGRGRDAATDLRITLQSMLGVLVPEVKGPVGPGRAECAVDRMEADRVYGVDADVVSIGWRVVAMAFE